MTSPVNETLDAAISNGGAYTEQLALSGYFLTAQVINDYHIMARPEVAVDLPAGTPEIPGA